MTFFLSKRLQRLSLTLSIVLCAAPVVSLRAQVATFGDNGDLILGFRATGGSGANKSLLIDLGSYSSIAATGGFTLDFSSAGSVLASTFGANWTSRNDLYWGTIGSDANTVDLWISRKTGSTYPAGSDGSSPPITTGELASINQNFGNMQVASASGNATQTTFIDSAGISHAVSVYPTSNSGSWQFYASTGFGYFPNSTDILVSYAQTIAYYTSDYADTGAGIAPVDQFSLTNNNGVISLSLTAAPTPTPTPAPTPTSYSGPWLWTNGSGNWSSSNNWVSNSPAPEGQDLGITGSAGGTITNNLVASIGGLTFGNGAGSYTLTGTNPLQRLTVTGGITNNSASLQTVALGLTVTNAQTFNAASGDLAFTVGISNSAILSLQEGEGRTLRVTAPLTGPGSLVQKGAGTLVLSGSNSFSGGAVLNGGTVVVDDNSSLGTGSLTVASNSAIAALAAISTTNAISVLSGATASLDNRGNLWTLGGQIAGDGGLLLSGSGTTALSSSNGYAAGTVLNGGTVALGNNASFGTGTVTVASNTVISERVASLVLSNSVSVAGGASATLDNFGGSWSQAGSINGAGAVTFSGTGTTTLSSSNGYTGPTTLSAGTLRVNGSLAGSGTVSVGSGSTLSGTGSVGTVIVGSGGAVLAGTPLASGTLSLSGSVWNGGGNYTWKIGDTGRDLLLINGLLNLSSLSSSNTFAINLASMGAFTGFNANASTNWTIATFGSVAGFSTNDFTLSSMGFSPATNGVFGLATNASGLVITYTTAYVPPSSGSVWNAASGNLSANPAITNGSALLFAGSGGSVTNDSLGNVSALSYSNTAGSYNFSGNSLMIGSGGIANNSTNTQTVSTSLTLGASQSFTAGSGSLVIAGNVASSGNTLTVNGSNNTLMTGSLSGIGGIVKSGAGTLMLTGADTFTGGVSIVTGTVLLSGGDNRLWTNGSVAVNGGMLDLGTNAQQLAVLSGSGTVTGRAGSTLTLAPSGTTLFSGTIAGGESLAVAGQGTLILSGNNSYTGGTVVSGGTLLASNALALGVATNSLGVSTTLNLGSQTITQGAVTVSGGTVTNGVLAASSVSLQDASVSASLSGSAVVTQVSGTTVLSGSNRFTGGTVVNGGTLVASNSSALAGGDADVRGGTLQLTGISQTLNAVSLGNGTITGSGTLTATSVTATNTGLAVISEKLGGAAVLTQAGSGTTVLSGSNVFTGGTVVSGGTLVASNASALGGTNGTLAISGGRIDLGGFSRTSGAVTFSGGSIGNGTLVASAGVSVSGSNAVAIDAVLPGSVSLTKTGTGTLSINSAFPNGTLQIGGGTLRTPSSVTALAAKSASLVTVTNAFWRNNGQLTVGGSGSATLAVGSGGTVVAAGLLIASNASSKGTVVVAGDASGSGSLEIMNSITFGAGTGNLVFAQSGSVLCGSPMISAVSKKGTVTVSGSGTTTFTADNNPFTGSVYLSGGTTVLGQGARLGGTISIANKAAILALNTNAVLSGKGSVAVAGKLLDNSGLPISNSISGQVVLASTGVLQKTYAAGSSVAGFGAGIGAGKKFSILSGSVQNDATLDAHLVDGALDFKGTFANGIVFSVTDPSFSAIRNTIQWYNTNTATWQNTVFGNTGNVANASLNGLNGKVFGGSFATFLLQASKVGILNSSTDTLAEINVLPAIQVNATLAKIMGAYGYDASTKTSWAVIDHNSLFSSWVPGSSSSDLMDAALNDSPVTADLGVFGSSSSIRIQAVPEPSTWGLIVTGGLALTIVFVRRRKCIGSL